MSQQDLDLSDIGPCAREQEEEDGYEGFVDQVSRLMKQQFKAAFRGADDTLGGWKLKFDCGRDADIDEMKDAIYQATGARPRTRITVGNPDSGLPTEVQFLVQPSQLRGRCSLPPWWIWLLVLLALSYWYRSFLHTPL